jgi:hypothetical protein
MLKKLLLSLSLLAPITANSQDLTQKTTPKQTKETNQFYLGSQYSYFDVSDVSGALEGIVKKASKEVDTNLPVLYLCLGYEKKIPLNNDLEFLLGAKLSFVTPVITGDIDEDGSMQPVGLPKLLYDMSAQMDMLSLPINFGLNVPILKGKYQLSIDTNLGIGPSYLSSDVKYNIEPEEEELKILLDQLGVDNEGKISIDGWGVNYFFELGARFSYKNFGLRVGFGLDNSYYSAHLNTKGINDRQFDLENSSLNFNGRAFYQF